MDSSNYPGAVTKFEYSEVKNGTRMEGSHEVPNYQHSFVAAQSGNIMRMVLGLTTTRFIIMFSRLGITPRHSISRQVFTVMRKMHRKGYYASWTSSAIMPAKQLIHVLLPCVTMYGLSLFQLFHRGGLTMRAWLPFTDWNGKTTYIDDHGNEQPLYVNMNRNYDVIHQYTLASAGTGGNYPWQFAEIRHIKSIIDNVGPQNMNYDVLTITIPIHTM